jgi:hypothetical protein
MGGGYVCELQLHVKPFIDAKNAAGHKVYDVTRRLRERPLTSQELDAVESAKETEGLEHTAVADDLLNMEAFSQEIYGVAETTEGSITEEIEKGWEEDARMKLVKAYKDALKV